MFPDMGDRETFEQTFKITNISATMFLNLLYMYSHMALVLRIIYFHLFLDCVNCIICMYIYISNFGGIFSQLYTCFAWGATDSDKVSFYLLIHVKIM